MNEVDKCFANKEFNGNQFTTAWYVDDNKISHVNPDMNTAALVEIEQLYRSKVASTAVRQSRRVKFCCHQRIKLWCIGFH